MSDEIDPAKLLKAIQDAIAEPKEAERPEPATKPVKVYRNRKPMRRLT